MTARDATRIKQGRELILDLVAAIIWTIYSSVFLAKAIRTGKVIDLGVLIFLTLITVLFLIRRPARMSGAPWETLLALLAFLPPSALRPARGGVPWLGEAIQLLTLVGMAAAAISLGRSFGIAPADRGLRTGGLYAWVRHPLYATELCFYLGYLVANPSWWNLAMLIVVTALQIVRITREERILDGYALYAQQVRYRLVPFIW
jgi:protein-S-isoprenylcysteine O-methyltransferase Ste14